jgi:long-chain acyl-CoA synthetase
VCVFRTCVSESKYAHAPVVDNICVVGNSHHGAPVALVAPNHAKLVALAATLGVNSSDVAALCANPTVISGVLSQLNSVATSQKLEKWERLAAVQLYAQPWTPDSGLLTEAMKIKRHEVGKRFKEDIDRLYKNVP